MDDNIILEEGSTLHFPTRLFLPLHHHQTQTLHSRIKRIPKRKKKY